MAEELRTMNVVAGIVGTDFNEDDMIYTTVNMCVRLVDCHIKEECEHVWPPIYVHISYPHKQVM